MQVLDLSDFFTTKPQAVDFSARLSNISDKIYELDFNLEKELQEQFGIKKKDKFISLLRKNEVPAGSNTALSDFLVKIQKTISSLSTTSIAVAIEPDEETLKEISNWFLLNLKRQVLVEIQVDPSIIAGAIIGYQGKRFNASVKSIFDKVYGTSLKEDEVKEVNKQPKSK